MITLVLLIDSDIPFMVNIKKAMEDTGEFHVSLAANGPAAEDALRRVAHDVAIVDFEASDQGDIMELLRLLRQTQPALPVIVAPHTDLQHERAQFLDVQGVIPRPYTARTLIPYVRDVLSRGRPQAHITPPPAPVTHTDDFATPEIPAALRDLFPEETDDRLLNEDERRTLREQIEYLESGTGSPAEILEEFEAMERAQTGMLDDPHQTRYLGDADQPTDTRPLDDDPYQTRRLDGADHSADVDLLAGDPHQTRPLGGDPNQTRYLGDADQPPDTAHLTGDPYQTRRLDDADHSADIDLLAADLHKTRSLGDADQPPEMADDLHKTRSLGDADQPPDTSARSDVVTRPLGPRPDEPPPKPDDTPAVPEHDLNGVRQFLATDPGEHDSSEFGEVLEAVAHSQPSDFSRSPHDRAFHDLVDSMRGSDQETKRRTWLDDLLSSIAASVPSPEEGGALDYVLDAIRQNAASDVSGESDLDDTTIGEVIDGLFDPSFEGVLAALSGEEIDEAGYDEPSYAPSAAEGLEPPDSDRFTPDEMSDEDSPTWLFAYEAEGIEPPPTLPDQESAVEEPPVSTEDSSTYPATAVLSAAESSDEFSFDDLLNQIEHQLPPHLARRPHLKPLPSWGTKALKSPEVSALFDRVEGIRPERPEPGDLAEAMTDAGPDIPEESALPDAQDTRPSRALRDEIESSAFQERDTQPYGPIVPEEARAKPIEIWEDSAIPSGDEIPMLSMDDLLAIADLPAEAGTEELQAELGRRVSAEESEPYPPESGVEESQPYPVESDEEIAQAFYAGVRDAQPYHDEIPPEAITPDDDHLIPVPVEEAARLLEGDVFVDEEAEIAQAAVQLTQFSLESSAQATILSRPGRLLAAAGDLPEQAISALFTIVDDAWQTTTTVSDSLIRFITLPDVGEFLLYSAQVEAGMTLSMIFHADTPVRAIRRQARRLSASLDLIPETPEPPAAQTRPSRPTDLRPPVGLREAVAETAPEEGSAPVGSSAEDEGPYTAYTCLWLPRDPGLELQGDLVSALSTWIPDAAQENQWEVEELDIWPDYVLMTLRVPQKLLPDDIIVRLMDETTHRWAGDFPDLAAGGPLWCDGYYVVSPARALTDREIARFITYQRQSQAA
jgi:DNA-binding NarL/FixJ family response regulator/REP element-mobilizing transposase RayT